MQGKGKSGTIAAESHAGNGDTYELYRYPEYRYTLRRYIRMKYAITRL